MSPNAHCNTPCFSPILPKSLLGRSTQVQPSFFLEEGRFISHLKSFVLCSKGAGETKDEEWAPQLNGGRTIRFFSLSLKCWLCDVREWRGPCVIQPCLCLSSLLVWNVSFIKRNWKRTRLPEQNNSLESHQIPFSPWSIHVTHHNSTYFFNRDHKYEHNKKSLTLLSLTSLRSQAKGYWLPIWKCLNFGKFWCAACVLP